jgi:hypothetical protein
MSTSSSSSSSTQPPEIVLCGECGDKPKKGVTFKTCSGCAFVAYCCAACQIAAWPGHRPICKEKKKERATANAAKEAAATARGSGGGSGSGLRDMGSIMAALMPQPQPQPQRYTEIDLYNACLQGRHEKLQKILRQREVDVNWARPDTEGTAAFIASQEGHAQCLSTLIKHGGVDLSKAAKNGCAPIHMACQEGRYACLEILLDNHVDANLRVANDESGTTPAIMATTNGHVKLLALLLDRGADQNLANRHGVTAAHKACQYGHLKCLQARFERSDSAGLC